jgi:DNA-binding CsgD family transcriptional regulator
VETDLSHALDLLGDGVALFGQGAGLRRANAEMWRLVAGPGGEGVWREVLRLAEAAWEDSRTRSEFGPGALLEGEVRTPEGTIRLGASPWPAGPFATGGGVLVVARLIAERGVEGRFGLSPQESRVARLLAQGLSNAEVARQLCISAHTARHHTQRVLSKLEVRSRAAVAAKLLSD